MKMITAITPSDLFVHLIINLEMPGIQKIILLLTFFISSQPLIAQEVLIDNNIKLIHLQDSVFIHQTIATDETFGTFSSNGMVVIRSGEALMIDTPIDNEQTEMLVSWLNDTWGVKVSLFIAGHYHNDCLGGLEYLHRNDIKSLANILTIEKCVALKLETPRTSFNEILKFEFNGEPVICRFFGAGHTTDNITVWFPLQNILFGGCLIKAAESSTLGNLSDAVVSEWDITVGKLMSAYDNINLIVPGHGNAGGPELLQHTIGLVEAFNKKNQFKTITQTADPG